MRKQPSSTPAAYNGARSKASWRGLIQYAHAFLLERIIQNRVIQHGLFWMLSYYILLRFFAYEETLYTVDFVYTFLFHLSLVSVVYFNLFMLVPRLLNKQRYLFYILSLLLLLPTGIILNKFTFEYLADLLFPNFYFISYYDFFDIAQFFLAYLTLTTLLKLSKAWFKLDQQKKLMSRLEKEKLDTELNALKGQIDPHFFFNSLNNLYSLALEQDDRTADGILKLSQNMRYILYDCQASRVPLVKEIDHIQNYLQLQKLRLDGQAQVKLTLTGDFSQEEVAPLLFIPFVENGFKHGIKGQEKGAYINISFELQGKTLIFKTENNKGENEEWIRQQHRGIGISNTQRRLELTYPQKHELQIVDGIEHFSVILKLDLS